MKRKKKKKKKKYTSLLKALSGLCINISAAWFGVAIITPNFSTLTNFSNFFTLTREILFGIVFLLLTIAIEERIDKK